MKRMILCVDDFGLKPEVNEAVLALVDAGVVSATGCMSQGPAWRQGAAALRGERRTRLDVGLHLCLTEAFPPLPGRAEPPWHQPLPHVILKALLRALDRQALHRAVRSQLDDFEDAFGAPPDFVDGHQHVHQLPQVREALLGELQRRYGSSPTGSGAGLPWLRLTRGRPGPAGIDVKQRVIELLGARGFERMARQAGFQLNGALLGVYGFDTDATGYAARARSWLTQAQDGDVLMMHPAQPGSAIHHGSTGTDSARAPSLSPPTDPIAGAREAEFTFWQEQGTGLLALTGVRSVRMADISSILRA